MTFLELPVTKGKYSFVLGFTFFMYKENKYYKVYTYLEPTLVVLIKYLILDDVIIKN